ncbi:hypothetical protein [Janibacter terrae]|uniref:hypothetical protein n=1 Tax=Janibacter terrae TaxID=103817 RepID=UPI0031F97624
MPKRPTDPFHDPTICPWCPDAAAATTPAAPIDTSQDDPPMNHTDRAAEAFTFEEKPTEATEHSHAGRSVKASCTRCDYWVMTWLPDGYPSDLIVRDHAAQHEPGRALDIDVDWVPRANCSVCEDGIGLIEVDADGDLACAACRTYWSIEGKGGTLREGGVSDADV